MERYFILFVKNRYKTYLSKLAWIFIPRNFSKKQRQVLLPLATVSGSYIFWRRENSQEFNFSMRVGITERFFVNFLRDSLFHKMFSKLLYDDDGPYIYFVFLIYSFILLNEIIIRLWQCSDTEIVADVFNQECTHTWIFNKGKVV